MTQPIGEEFIRFRPDFTGFREEMQAQLQAALAGVSPQIAAAQAQAARAAAAAAAPAEAVGGVILPSSVRSVTAATDEMRRFAAAGTESEKVIAATAAEAQRLGASATGAFVPLVAGAEEATASLEKFVVTGAKGEQTIASTAAEAQALAAELGGSFEPATAGLTKFIVTAQQGERTIVSTLAEAQALAAETGGTFAPLIAGAAEATRAVAEAEKALEAFVVTGAAGTRTIVATQEEAAALAAETKGTFAPLIAGSAEAAKAVESATAAMQRFIVVGAGGQRIGVSTVEEAQALAAATRGTFSEVVASSGEAAASIDSATAALQRFVVVGAQGQRIGVGTIEEAQAIAQATGGTFEPLTAGAAAAAKSTAAANEELRRFVVDADAARGAAGALREGQAVGAVGAAVPTAAPAAQAAADASAQRFVVTAQNGERAIAATLEEATALAAATKGTFEPLAVGAETAAAAVEGTTAAVQRFVVTAAGGERAIVETRQEAEALAKTSGGTFEPLIVGSEEAAKSVDAATAAMQKFVVTTRAGNQVIVQTAAEAQVLAARTAGSVTPLVAGAEASSTAQRGAAAASEELATATRSSNASLSVVSATSGRAAAANQHLSETIRAAEQDTGRFVRGTVAATAASTGFFRAVSFASGAFLIGATLGATIGTAVDTFKQMVIIAAQTTQLIKATGAAANVTAGQVDELAKSQSRLTGTSAEVIQRAANVLLTFRGIRNEGEGLNAVFTRSVKAVEDISSVFGTSLTSTAVQLGKALQDPVKGVTALRRSGITLTQSQRDLIKALSDAGRTLDEQKVVLGAIETQVGGTAEAIGRTLPGRLAILREQGKRDLGDLVKRISESQKATQGFSDTMGGLHAAASDAFAALRAVFTDIAKIVGGIAQVSQLDAVIKSIGGLKTLVQALALAGTAFAALRVSLLLASTAQGIYTRITTVATAATEAEGAAAVATAERVSLAAGLLRVALGPVGIALGVGALAVALIKLKDAAGGTPGTLQATQHALEGLNQAVQESNRLRGDIAGASENVSIARFNVQTAQRTVDRAQQTADQSNAPQGSLLRAHLDFVVAQAQDALKKANDELSSSEEKLRVKQEQQRENEAARPALIKKTTDALQQQLKVLRELGRGQTQTQSDFLKQVFALQGQAPQEAAQKAQATLQREAQLRGDIQRRLEKALSVTQALAASGGQVDKAVGGALFSIQSALNRVATPREIRIAVKLAGQGETANAITQELLKIDAAARPLFVLPGQQRGLLSPGNLDLLHRKVAQLGDGTIATVRSASTSLSDLLEKASASVKQQFGKFAEQFPNAEVLFPTVIKGQLVSLEQAEKNFERTGQNLGLFKNFRDADRYSEALHRQQQAFYSAAGGARQLARDVTNLAGRESQAEQRGIPQAPPDLEDRFKQITFELSKQQKILATIRDTEGATASELKAAGITRSEGVKQAKQALEVAKQTVATDRQTVQNARDSVSSALESLAQARRSFADAQSALRDTIIQSHLAIAQAVTASRQAVTAAVTSAKQNLQSLGSALASTLQQFTAAGGKFGIEVPKQLGANFQRLRQQILAGAGGPETQTAAEQIAFQISAPKTAATDKLQRAFDDLSFDLASGSIKNMREFNKRLNAIIANLDPQKLKATLGSAAAGQFLENLEAFRKQAAAILSGPQRAGGTGAPQVISPAQALVQGAKAIHDARVQAAKDIAGGVRAVGDAARGIRDAERQVDRANRELTTALDRLRRDQVKATRDQTAATKANTRAADQLAKVLALREQLNPNVKAKQKGNGAANAASTGVVSKGATAP